MVVTVFEAKTNGHLETGNRYWRKEGNHELKSSSNRVNGE